MEAIDHLHRLPKEPFDGRCVRLGHIQHHHCNPVEFSLRTALEPGDDILGTSPLQRGNRATFVQVNDRGVVPVPLAPGVFINPDGAAQLPWASTPTPLKGPAEHGALGEPIAPGQLTARTPPKELPPDLVVETLSPFNPRTEGLTRLPGPMVATLALKAPQMQPQQNGTLQDGQVANAPRPALLDSGTTRLASGTHDGGVPPLEMQIQPLWAAGLIDDAEFGQTEQSFDTIDIHAQGSSFGGRVSRILQGILRVSITALSHLLSSSTSGLKHGEEPHLTDPQRLSRLLIASCLAYIWLVYLGSLCKKERWQSIIHRRKRCDLSLFQLGLRL